MPVDLSLTLGLKGQCKIEVTNIKQKKMSSCGSFVLNGKS